MKKALITEITGQDGSYLAELLLEKGYEVHGIIRLSSSFNTGRIEHLYIDDLIEDMHKNRKVILHYGDMTDSESMIRIIREVEPDEIYNLAAQSHVQVSFEVTEFIADCDATGVLVFLKQFTSLVWKRNAVSIRLLHLNYSDLYRKFHRKKQPHSIHVHHTQLQKCTVSGL